jgi:two-component system, cell cycle sensor histidine kinase and response regulator CckA
VQVVETERRRLLLFRKVFPLLQWLPGFVLLYDRERRVRFANRCFRDRFGDSGRHLCHDVLTGHERSCAECAIYDDAAVDSPREWEGILPDGRTYRIHALPFIEEDGSPFVLVLGVDVTGPRPPGEAFRKTCEALERRIAERAAEITKVNEDLREEVRQRREAEIALREATHTLRGVIHASPLAVLLLDPEGRITLWNPAAERIFGWSEGEVLGRFNPTVPEEEAEAFRVFLSRALAGETFTNVGGRRRRKDGTLLDVLVSTAPLRDAEGTIAGNISIIADVTERKRAEEALAAYRQHLEELVRERTAELTQANEKLREEVAERKRAEAALRKEQDFSSRILGVANALIVVLDREGRIVLFNRKCEEVTGWSEAEVRGRPIWDILLPERFVPVAREEFARLGERDAFSRFENSWLTRGGRERIVEWSNAVLRDETGEVALVIGTGVDITDRRSLEEQLRHAQRLEAVGRLAGGIAHEFNNMMTVVTGYGELLLSRLGAGDPMRPEIEQIKRAGDRAASLTRQLLAFSRKQVLQPRELDLNAVVLHMDKMLRRLIGEDVALVTVPAEGLWTVKADPGQLEQVLVNLAVNARDAMPGGGRLLVETANVVLDEACAAHRPEVAPGPYVLLSMADTGVGMDEETRTHLFEPFYTTKGPGKGTGLGLATVYGIVAQSGGHIDVESAPGQGTTFRIYLPRAGGVPREVEEPEAEAPRGRETVLVVEDEEAVRRLVREVLLAQGYRVLEAPGGEEALSLCAAAAEPVDLVLTDVVMPGMSGRELAARLREAVPDIRILFMSGHTETAVLAEGTLRSPREAFLQKPFPQNALARKIRELLDGTE